MFRAEDSLTNFQHLESQANRLVISPFLRSLDGLLTQGLCLLQTGFFGMNKEACYSEPQDQAGKYMEDHGFFHFSVSPDLCRLPLSVRMTQVRITTAATASSKTTTFRSI
jgi:hypothetical protein